MADTHTIKVAVDASQARGELDSLGKSVGNVTASLKSIGETGNSFANLSRQLSAMSSGFDKLRSISGLRDTAKDIREMSAALNSVRGPSSAAIGNITSLERAVRSLANVRVGSQVARDVTAIGSAFGSMRITPTAAANINRVVQTLNTARINPTLASGLHGLGNAIQQLRSPSSTTVNNLQRLIQTLGSGNVGTVTAMANALRQLSNINLNVRPPAPPRQPPGSGGGHGGSGWGAHNVSLPGLPRLTGELRGLENAFSATYQAASMFRTAIGAITLGEFAHGIYETGNNLMSFRIAMDSVATDSSEVGRHFEFIKKTATDLGASLDDMIPAYQRLAASMRSLGYSEKDAQDTFRGFQTALTANHVALSEQKNFMRELMETFAMGGGHATQVMRGMASHYPQLIGIMQTALNVSGEGLKKIFRDGGISAKQMIAIAREAEKQSAAGAVEALNHSMSQVAIFQNRFTQLKQTAFDKGFDSGLTTFLKEIGKAMDDVGFDNLGAKLGEGFRVAFAGATVFTKALIENRETIFHVIKAAAEIAGLYQIFKVVATGAELLAGTIRGVGAALIAIGSARSGFAALGAMIGAAAIPLGALTAGIITVAAVAAMVYVAWDDLNAAFSTSGPIIDAIKAVATGLFQVVLDGINMITKAAVGAASFLYNALKTNDWSKGWAAAQSDMANVGTLTFDKLKSGAESGLKKGIEAGSKALDSVYTKMGAAFSKFAPGGDFQKYYDQSKPAEFHGTNDSQYAANMARDINRAAEDAEKLSKETEKLIEKLLPDLKATKELAANYKQIADLQERINAGQKVTFDIGGTKQNIDQAMIDRLKAAAQEKALEKFDPTAIKIRDKMDELKLHAEHMGKGNKSDWAVEKEIISEKLALKKKGLEMTAQEEDALRRILALEKEMAKGGADGFSQWANSQKSAIDGMNDSIKSGMDSVADGITKIVTEGKGKFRNLGEAIRAEFSDIMRGIARNFINNGIRSLMAEGLKGLDLGNMQGKIKEALGFGQAAVDSATSKMEDMLKTTSLMEVQAGVVNVNGASISGLGGAAGAAEKALSGGEKAASQTISAASGGVKEMGGMSMHELPLVGAMAKANPTASVADGTKALEQVQKLSGIAPGSTEFASHAPTGPLSKFAGPLKSPMAEKPSVGPMDFGSAKLPSMGEAPSIRQELAPTKNIGDTEFGKASLPSLGTNPGIAPKLIPAAPKIEQPKLPEFGTGKAVKLPDNMNMLPKVAPPKVASPAKAFEQVKDAPQFNTTSDIEAMYKAAKLPKGTETQLRTVHPDLQKTILQAKMDTGADIYMNSGMGLRTKAQALANARSGKGIVKSRHLDGEAADVLIKDKAGHIIEDGSRPEYASFNQAVQGASKKVGTNIKWGGEFKRHDWDHWELGERGKNTPLAKRGFTDYAGVNKEQFDAARKATEDAEKKLSDPFKGKKVDYEPTGSIKKMDSHHLMPGGLAEKMKEQELAKKLADNNPVKKLSQVNPVKKLSSSVGQGLDTVKQETQKVAKQLSKSVTEGTKPLTKELTSKFTDVGKKITESGAINKLSDSFSTVSQTATQGVQAASSLGGQVGTMASTMAQQGVSSVTSFTDEISKLIEKMMSGLGGGGGGLGSLLGGLFSEGGYSDSAVSSASMPASFWAGAPQYAEGTPNTSGGMPAILHDNEAVIPLSRGRSIPVEFPSGSPGGAQTSNNNTVNVNIAAKDYDSFRRNKGQLSAGMQQQIGRLAARNN